MDVVLLTIGDEVLDGRITNSNASYIGQYLTFRGHRMMACLSVGDNHDSIMEAINYAQQLKPDWIVTTGGLGPTLDDLTVESVAGQYKVPLVEHPETLKKVRQILAQRNRPWTENNRRQALIPQGARVIDNPAGIAPGIVFQNFIMLPGVPWEMKALIDLTPLAAGTGLAPRVWNCFGATESQLDAIIRDLQKTASLTTNQVNDLGVTRVNFRINFPCLEIRAWDLTADESARWDIALLPYTFSNTQGESLAEVLVKTLRKHKLMLATAESCTGGLAISKIVAIEGTSDVVFGGAVTYANEAKNRLLGVSPGMIETEGAVSELVVRAMAQGALAKIPAQLNGACLAITGIAGPTGGTAAKPVGTVWIAVGQRINGNESVVSREFRFGEGRPRHVIQELAVGHAFWMLLHHLDKKMG